MRPTLCAERVADMRYVAALTTVAAAGLVTALALTLGRGHDRAPTVLVDERTGVLHGVRFGASEQKVRDRRGEPSDDREGYFPEGADYTGPPAIPGPQVDQTAPRRAPTALHYGQTAYLVSPTVGVFSMTSLERGARTHAGIGVGDELRLVRGRYERVACGKATAGEPLFGGEAPTFRGAERSSATSASSSVGIRSRASR
jgi:hypothetical protein